MSLPTSRIWLPTRSLENTAEVRDEDEGTCERCEEPESVVPFDGLWGGWVSVRRQMLFLGFAHSRGDDGRGREGQIRSHREQRGICTAGSEVFLR